MDHQPSFAQAEYAAKKKITRRDKFLAQMDCIVPWAEFVELIRPHYPKGKRGRPPIGIDRMLRIYFLQQWFGLADEALEDAIYDSLAMRLFVGIDLGAEPVPDATTLLHFRRLLETHKLTEALFQKTKTLLIDRNILLKEGTIVDATIINAPSSTKNKNRKRDSEMHQTRKGNQWYFGIKAHVGADAASGTVHSLEATAAHVSDLSQAHKLLHGQEKMGFADAGYPSVHQRPAVKAKNPTMRWHVAVQRGRIAGMAEGPVKQVTRKIERLKASVRAKVEHNFHVIKNIFRHRKTRYRGLAKNRAQLFSLFALSNLYLARNRLLATA